MDKLLFGADSARPVEVHIYRIRRRIQIYYYIDSVLAVNFARSAFARPGVYKVKVWDKRLGPILAGRLTAEALLLVLT